MSLSLPPFLSLYIYICICIYVYIIICSCLYIILYIFVCLLIVDIRSTRTFPQMLLLRVELFVFSVVAMARRRCCVYASFVAMARHRFVFSGNATEMPRNCLSRRRGASFVKGNTTSQLRTSMHTCAHKAQLPAAILVAHP